MTATKTKAVTPGSDVTWSVSATGFDTQSGTINDIADSQTLDVYLLGSYGTIDKAVKDVQTSDNTTWILLNDGTLWGCGLGMSGQQGDNQSSTYPNFHSVTTFTQRLTDVAQINCSNNTTWALKTDGTLWGCGLNDKGEQGSGNTTNVLTFTQRLTDVAQVFIGYYGYTTGALKTDGTLWGCGKNNFGQQGSGNTNSVLTFTQRLTDVAQVTGNGYTALALKTDGTLWECGYNKYGEQGSGNTDNVLTFTQRLTDVAQVTGSEYTAWALKTDGTVWGCGYGNYGQQGNGGLGNSNKVTSFTTRNPTVEGYNSAKLTINPTPADATVTINTESVKTKDIRKGTSAEWSVSKNGYVTQTGTIAHIYDNTSLNIILEAE
jgi:alpha-tubulin suppressor-like RCC1 family protein